MQKLVIRLHAQDLAHPSFAVVSEDGVCVEKVMQADTALLVDAAKNRETIVIVPPEDVLLTAVILPKMNRARLLQAVPYALEEQIIEDVEAMHFAVGDYQPDLSLPVLVVTRKKMHEWMSLLASFQVKPDSMLSAILALPFTETDWHAAVNDIAFVRTGFASGFACDRVNFSEMLSLAYDAAVVKPQQITLQNAGEFLSFQLPCQMAEQRVSEEEILETIARQAAQSVPVNVLQGEFQNKKARGLPQMSHLIRAAVYLGIAWAVLIFMYPIVSYALLNHRANEIKKQITVIYKRQFPSAASIVAPKERMQQKINKLSEGGSDSQLFMMMANIGKGLSVTSGVQLKRMTFQNNAMTLEISAASSDVFSMFTNALTQQGLRVKQQNANLNGTRVSATLEIE